VSSSGHRCTWSVCSQLRGAPNLPGCGRAFTAAGTTTSAVAGLTHSDLFWAVVLEAAAASGLAAYLALLPHKKPIQRWHLRGLTLCNLQRHTDRCFGRTLHCLLQPRLIAGVIEVPAAHGWSRVVLGFALVWREYGTLLAPPNGTGGLSAWEPDRNTPPEGLTWRFEYPLLTVADPWSPGLMAR